MGFFKEFRDFAFKGNLLDLAIAVVLGAAFGRIITALVDNILMPILGTFIGSSFMKMSSVINGVPVTYGVFIQEFVNFVIIAFVVFLVVKTVNRFKKKQDVVAAGPSSTDILLMEIRDELRKNKV